MTAGLPPVTTVALTEIDHQRRGEWRAVSGVISTGRNALVRLTGAGRMAENINEAVLAESRASAGMPSKSVWAASTVARMPAAAEDRPDAGNSGCQVN